MCGRWNAWLAGWLAGWLSGHGMSGRSAGATWWGERVSGGGSPAVEAWVPSVDYRGWISLKVWTLETASGLSFFSYSRHDCSLHRPLTLPSTASDFSPQTLCSHVKLTMMGTEKKKYTRKRNCLIINVRFCSVGQDWQSRSPSSQVYTIPHAFLQYYRWLYKSWNHWNVSFSDELVNELRLSLLQLVALWIKTIGCGYLLTRDSHDCFGRQILTIFQTIQSQASILSQI